MTHTLAGTHAVAVEFRRTDTDAVIGIALVVPAEQCVSVLSDDTGTVSTPALSEQAWREVDAWDEEAAARLPFKPEPIPAAVVNALLDGAPGSAVVARRFAAIPISVESRDGVAPLLDKMLPGLLNSRRVT